MKCKLQTAIAFLFFLSVTLVTSCKKEILVSSIKAGSKAGPIPSYDFDWESATYVPTSPANVIQMPWNSGTSQIDGDLVGDYHKSNGWKLVYNTFTPNTPTSGSTTPYFFCLYNQYRGLLRFYVYQPPTAIYSSYIQHGLNLYGSGANSSMLDLEGGDIVDYTNNTNTFSKITNQTISSNGGSWFLLQYAIAYDPTIANTTFPNVGLGINALFVNVTTIKLSGTEIGTIGGTISTPANTFSLSGAGGSIVKGLVEVAGAYGAAQIKSDPKSFGNSALKQLTSVIDEAIKGNITGFFSATIGALAGSGGTTQQVNLKLNTQIDLAGTAVNNGTLTNMKLTFPGQLNSQTADGLTPIYNQTMGVFKLNSKPTVNYTQAVNPQVNAEGTYYIWEYWNNFAIDPNSISFTINPVVSNIATVNVVKSELVYIDQTTEANTYVITGKKEVVGSLNAFTTTTEVKQLLSIFNPNGPGNPPPSAVPLKGYFAVRVTMDVIPNDGTPKSTIVNTFLANAVKR